MVKGKISKIIELKLHPYQTLTIMLCAFILGIWLGGFTSLVWRNTGFIVYTSLLSLLLCAFVNKLLKNQILVLSSWLIFFILLGVAIYVHQNSYYFGGIISENENLITGTIVNNPSTNYKNQELIIESNNGGQKLKILIKAPRQPQYYYGDVINVEGKIEKPGMIEDFDYARYLKPKKVSYVILNSSKIKCIESKKDFRWQTLRSLFNVKDKFESSLNQLFHEPYASLSVGLITGAKRSMPQELTDSLNAAGLTHIVALSGYNVTIIIIALSAIFANIMNRKKIFIAGSILVIIFIVMTGASASVVRAGIFSLLILYGKTIGRNAYQTNILLLAAAIMLMFNPFLLSDDLGFQLSFLAFGGLIYLSKITEYSLDKSLFKKLPEWVKSPLTETLSAQIAVFPLIAFSFGRVSLISPLSNIVVLWIIPLAMLLSFITGIFGILSYQLGKIAAFIAYPVLIYIIKITNVSAKVPLASVALQKYNYFIVLSFYVLIAIWLAAVKRKIYQWQKILYE